MTTRKGQFEITLRPAVMTDARDICALVNHYAERGRMLHRSLESVYESLREFQVAQDRAGRVVGCVAVDLFWADLAEIKSLAVSPDKRRLGIGRKLIQGSVRDARRLGIKKLFALTYEKEFFAGLGFAAIDRDRLPEKVWTECVFCPKADACDETAMMLRLEPPAPRKKRPAGRR